MRSDLQKPDIVTVIEGLTAELYRSGRTLRGKCPIHNGESSGSLAVYPDDQSWHCFGGCGSGDVISFIMALRSCDFKQACQYLGISSKATPPSRAERARIEKKRQLIAEFRQWVTGYHNELCRAYRWLQLKKESVKTEADAEALAWAYQRESLWLARLEVLESNATEAQRALYAEVSHGMPL